MKVHLKMHSPIHATAWVESWIRVIAEAKLIITDSEILVDNIETVPEFRRKGHASAIINRLKEFGSQTGRTVRPFGIVNRPNAKAFWKKHDLEDRYES